MLALAGKVALQPEAAGAGLIHQFQPAVAAELLDQSIDGVLLRADGADVDDRVSGRGADARNGDGILVNIQTNIGSAIFGHADLR